MLYFEMPENETVGPFRTADGVRRFLTNNDPIGILWGSGDTSGDDAELNLERIMSRGAKKIKFDDISKALRDLRSSLYLQGDCWYFAAVLNQLYGLKLVGVENRDTRELQHVGVRLVSNEIFDVRGVQTINQFSGSENGKIVEFKNLKSLLRRMNKEFPGYYDNFDIFCPTSGFMIETRAFIDIAFDHMTDDFEALEIQHDALVLVHPGSALRGPDEIVSKMTEELLNGNKIIVVDGAFSDELKGYGEIKRDLSYIRNNADKLIWGDDSDGTLDTAGKRVARNLSKSDRIAVTGAWHCSEDPRYGCVNSVCRQLRALGYDASISRNAVPDIDETPEFYVDESPIHEISASSHKR